MLWFTCKRLIWAGALLLAISLVTFVIFYVVPYRDPTLGGAFGNPLNDDSGINRFQVEGAFFDEYGRYLGDLLRGDLGTSWRTREDVTTILARALPPTFSLIVGGAIVWLALAFGIGVASGMHARGLFDRVSMIGLLIAIAAHPLWLGYMTAWLFGFKLGWVPLTGYCEVVTPPVAAQCGGPVQWAYHLLLPWLVFGLGFAAMYARMVRASVLETGEEDFVRTGRAKGVSEIALLRRHVFPNAVLPIVAMLGMDLGALGVTASIFVEKVFQIPGVGSLLIQSVRSRDLPVVLGVMVVVAVAVALINLVADLVLAALDPRIAGIARARPPAGRRTGTTVQPPTVNADRKPRGEVASEPSA